MTATPTPLRELLAKWRKRDIFAFSKRDRNIGEEAREAYRECADELEAALSARDEAGAVEPAMGLARRNFREETFAEARQQLVNVLKAQKSWLTGYAEAYVDDFADLARATPPASGEAGAYTQADLNAEYTRGRCDGFDAARATPPAASGDDSVAETLRWLDGMGGARFGQIATLIRRLAAVAPAGMVPVGEVTGSTYSGHWMVLIPFSVPRGTKLYATPPATAGKE